MNRPESHESHYQPTRLLIERHRAGDPDALRTLVERYYPRVQRIVGVRLGGRLIALTTVDDVVQDVFARVIEKLEDYEPREDASWIDWVARIAEREIIGQARYHGALKRDVRLIEQVRAAATSVGDWSLPTETTNVDSKVARRELEQRVDRCLAELAPTQREVILLRDYAGMDWRVIAERLDRPSPEACQELHRRALQALRELVQRRA